MVCVVVTRGGEGSAWRFDSVIAADDHPLVQYGDAYLRSPEDVRRCFSMREMSRLLGALGDERRRQEAAHLAETRPSDRELADISRHVWEALQRAPSPPSDPAIICAQVTADRQTTRKTGVTMRAHPAERDRSMSETSTETAEKKSRPIPRQPKYADATVISFGKDKEGNSYGPDRNPKKAGSKAHDAFSKYADGMTVAEAKAAGISLRDIDFDAGKGFIVLQ